MSDRERKELIEFLERQPGACTVCHRHFRDGERTTAGKGRNGKWAYACQDCALEISKVYADGVYHAYDRRH